MTQQQPDVLAIASIQAIYESRLLYMEKTLNKFGGMFSIGYTILYKSF